MKKRIFQRLVNDRLHVLIETEDWSCGDLDLIRQFGEPEIDVGGSFSYVDGTAKAICEKEFPTEFVRILHGFPYSRIFDARDYGSFEEARAVAEAWKVSVLGRIDSAVEELRRNNPSFATEEVYEI